MCRLQRVKALRIRSFCVISGLILLLAALPLIASTQTQETPAIRDIRVRPSFVYTEMSCWVQISASIRPDATSYNSTFKLLRLDEKGTPKVIFEGGRTKVVPGMLVKDGSLEIPFWFNEPNPIVIKLQVSAEYPGGRNEISEVFSLKVEPKPDLSAIEASWNEFVKKMVNKDLSGAAQYWMESERESFKKDMNELGMRRASSWYKTVREVKLRILEPGVIEVLFRITLGWGMDRDGIVAFRPDTDGVWRIHGSVFSQTDS